MDMQAAARAESEHERAQLEHQLRLARAGADAAVAKAAEAAERHTRESSWLHGQLDAANAELSMKSQAADRREADAARRLRGLQAALARRRELLETVLRQQLLQQTDANSESADDGTSEKLFNAALHEIREQLLEEVSKNMCCVCVELHAHVVLLPCRHKQLCSACAAVIHRCPICRAAISDRIEVFE